MIRSALIARFAAPWAALPDVKKGIICIIGVTFLFTCMDATAKGLTARHDPLFIVWVRYCVQALGTLLIFLPSLRQRMATRRLPLQIIRSALLFTATVLFYSGFAVLPLAQVISIAQLAPLFITVLAALILAERIGMTRWLGVLAGLAGALVIIRPGVAETNPAVLFPIFGAAAFAGVSIATRFLGGHDNVWTTFLYTGLVGAVVATFFAPFVWDLPSLTDMALMVSAGVYGGLGQLLLIFALSYAPASIIAPFLYLGVVWAALFGLVFFGEVPDVWTIIGAVMIIAAGLYVQRSTREKP